MDLIIPFMLIIVQWHPDHAGELVVERQPVLYMHEAECEQAGLDYVEQNGVKGTNQGGARFVYKCMPVPQVEEYEAAFEKPAAASQMKREAE